MVFEYALSAVRQVSDVEEEPNEWMMVKQVEHMAANTVLNPAMIELSKVIQS